MKSKQIQLNRQNNVGLYYRLSKDDDRDGGEKIVQTNIYLDSRKVAELLTPAISKELAWEGE